MADRKEPPFFNDESVGSFQYKLPFYDTMELYIETLTGTCFQLPVLPFEPILSVKTKIQRLEGIPVSQQHLIWNNVELDDDHCLHDYGIAEGCTLKLVLAMRGGPINTRKVTVEEPTKDLSELMDATKDQSAANKQVTFVVYREGDQLNVFRVVERGDATPLSQSISGGSVCNVFPEEEDGESALEQHSRDNCITMSKMKMLKAKMEDMNLNKKPKKSGKVKPRPPASPHPSLLTPSPSTQRHYPQQRLFRSLSYLTPSHSSASHLPPLQDACEPHFYTSPSSSYALQDEQWDTCPPLANIRPPPKVSRLELGGRLMRDCVYPQLPPLCTRGAPAAENLRLLEEPSPFSEFSEFTDPLTLDVSSPRDAALQMAWTLNSRERASARLGPPSPSTAQTLVKPVSPLPSRCLRGVKVESPSRMPELISKREVRGITRAANQAELLASLSSRPTLSARPTLSSRPTPSRTDSDGGREKLLLHRSVMTQMATSSETTAAGALTSVGRIGSSSQPLPPVRASAGAKKKTSSSSSKHCFHCGKKTGLATSFECRCGQNLCASHRYAESHACSYDYKSSGRRLLQEANPLISAPKLPKI